MNSYLQSSKDMKSEKRNDIASIERLTGKITVLTSEVKVLQSDQESIKI